MDKNKKIEQWVRDVFKNENFKKINIKLTGSSEKGDGYIGDIEFAKVNVVTSDGEDKNLELVIKYGKLDNDLRESMPIRQAFEKEVYVYSKIVPELRKFEAGKNLQIIDEIFPECYGTLIYDNEEEVILLQNLKAHGYELHDRYQTSDISHLKLTLEMYGKYHALSFAFVDQNPIKAEILFENLEDVFESFLKSMDNLMVDVQENLYIILRHKNEVGLIERMKKQIPDFSTTFPELLDMKNKKHRAFLHGDCWNNNFMFRYDSERSKPKAVKFLDFQMANFRPPVFDLAYHIYSVASEEELQHFDELLKIYHSSLSKTLKALGSDPDSIYSYEDLVQQWKQFAAFGVIMTTMILPQCLSLKEDTLDLNDMQESSQLSKTVKKTLSTNGDLLSSRTVAFTKHYLDFLEKY